MIIFIILFFISIIFLEENFIDNLNYFKKKNKVSINLETDNNLDISEYIIEFKNKTGKVIEKIEKISEAAKDPKQAARLWEISEEITGLKLN